MNNQPVVLVADDEPRILRLVAVTLADEGFAVSTASSGEEAIRIAEEIRPDIVLLDIVMPDVDGIEVMRQLREWRPVPVILLTAKGATADKVRGLNLGADDYLAKPFDPDELAGRVRAVLRRAAGIAAGGRALKVGEMEIDLERRMMTRNGELVELSRTEWMLLQHLAVNAGKVVLHNELLTAVWGPEYRDDLDYLRVWVSRVRRKLGAAAGESGPITTFQGIGYVLNVDEAPPVEAQPVQDRAAAPEPEIPAGAPTTPGVLVELDAVVRVQDSEARAESGAVDALERLRRLGPITVLAPATLRGQPLPRDPDARAGWVRRILASPDLDVADALAEGGERLGDRDASATAAWRSLRHGHGDASWLITADDDSTAAARRAGIGVIRVGPRPPSGPVADVARPDYAARDLNDAVRHVLAHSTFAESPAVTA